MTHSKVIESTDKAVLDVPVDFVDKFEVHGTVSGSSGPGGLPCSKRLEQSRHPPLPLEGYFRARRRANVQIRRSGDPRRFADFSGQFVRQTEGRGRASGFESGRLDRRATVPMHDVDLPRLAVYSTWGSTQEVGWVRYAFDKFEVPFDLIYKERVKQGNLHSSYDVIVIPNQGRGSKGLVYDIEPKATPLAYKKSDQFKTLGIYGESDDITGGMGLEGVVELQKFVEQGGLMITLGTASAFPADFGITRKVEAARTSSAFYAPGPSLKRRSRGRLIRCFMDTPKRSSRCAGLTVLY